MNKTGNRKGSKHTPEAKEKMRIAKLGKKRGKYAKKDKTKTTEKE